MRVLNLKLKNFRNYDDLAIDFFDGVNLISGQNGQGKTNIAEAVVVNALAKSPRTSHDEDMKKHCEKHAEAEVRICRKFGEMTIKTVIDDTFGKKFFINSNEVGKVADIFGNLVAVYFSPNDLKIVSESPAERRDFMDTDISMLSGSYYTLLQRYNKVLMQRNRLLKLTFDKNTIFDQIGVWNEQLSTLAGLVVKTRKSFVQKVKTLAGEFLKQISNGADVLEIAYVGAKGETSEEIKSEILKELEFNIEKDIEMGYTTVGPHRDDLKFEINSSEAKYFASQGQKRSIVLALKIAELKVFERELGEKPIFILDDVFSELDSSRQNKLYQILEDFQVLMTGTAFKFKPKETYAEIKVKQGRAKTKTIQPKIKQ